VKVSNTGNKIQTIDALIDDALRNLLKPYDFDIYND